VIIGFSWKVQHILIDFKVIITELSR